MGALIPITIMLGLGLAYWWATVQDKKRCDRVTELAHSLGLQITPELAPQDKDRFERFELAKMGQFQSVQMVLTADTGETRMSVFDFRYVKGVGKNRVDRFFSLVLCIDKRLQAPKMSLQPESWASLIAACVGSHDIDFEEDPRFSSAFHLTGADEKAVREFMNDPRRRACLAYPSLRWEVDGDCVLIVKPHVKLNAENLRGFMSEALTAAQVMIGPASSQPGADQP